MLTLNKFLRSPVLLLSLALCGCIQQQHMVWVNPGKPDSAFPADRYACLHDAAQVTPPATATADGPFGPYQYDVNKDSRDDLYVACMNAKNWHWVPAAAPATSIAPPSND
jgi:hypothetical protein